MQAAEMLRGTRAYVYHLVFLISLSVGYVHSFPLQVLPSIPGYIPVYIRHGDQPLEEINPALAEAFHERSSLSKISLGNVHDLTDIRLEEDEANKNHVEAVHIRQVDNNFSTEDETSKKRTGLASKTETLKRKAIFQPVLKLKPLTEEEKKDLEAYKIKIKETKNTNSGHESSTKSSELSSSEPHHEENVRKSNPVVKVDQIVIDESVKPDPYLIKDVPPSSTNEGTPMSKQMEEDTPESKHNDEGTTDEIPPVKIQNFPNLYNIHKLDVSPEVLLQLKERTENQSLEEKSK